MRPCSLCMLVSQVTCVALLMSRSLPTSINDDTLDNPRSFPLNCSIDPYEGNEVHNPLQSILDHSHLQPGSQAALLSYDQTFRLYQANAKKTEDPDVQFDFAVFMIDAAKSLPIPLESFGNLLVIERLSKKRDNFFTEATHLLKRLADKGHSASQYFLADCYANGIGTSNGRQDFDRAFALFLLAAKHGHSDAAYRAGTCCENGWGCRRESAKAVQFFRKAAASLHPGAMHRLGLAMLNGELGLPKNPKEGVKWLKRSAEAATAEFPHALHELALLHENGIENVLYADDEYAAELYARSAQLGYAPSAYRLGQTFEYGRMGCSRDPALSIHYYVSRYHASTVRTCSSLLVECRGTTEPPRCMLCSDCMVPCRVPWCAPAIRYRSVLMGEQSSTRWSRQSHVCYRLLL